MKKLITIFVAVLLVAFVPAFVHAQAIITPTSLSAALTQGGQLAVVASATGITAGTTSIYVDQELMSVSAVSGTTLTVIRGQGGTSARAHISGELVFFGPPNYFVTGMLSEPSGSCTRSSTVALPRINVRTGVKSDCVGGRWANGITVAQQEFGIRVPDPGGAAYTAINTNGTTLGATTMYCTEINLPHNMLLTGLGVLNGTTVGTDNHLVALYDSSGNLLANSDAAGALAATASGYQKIAFTSKFYAVGPAKYFGCLQTNGTTATVRNIVTGTQDTYLTKGVTSMTFGTIPATFTVPTTFTTAVGPYFQLY